MTLNYLEWPFTQDTTKCVTDALFLSAAELLSGALGSKPFTTTH